MVLGVIIICYIVFYVSFKYIRNNKIRIISFLAIILIGFVLVQLNLQFPVFNHEVGRGLSCFFIGGLLYYLELLIIKNRKDLLMSIISFFVLIGTFYLLFKIEKDVLTWYILVMFLFPNIILFLLNTKTLKKLLCKKSIEEASKLSYSIFLNQVFIMEVLFGLSRVFSFINFYSRTFFIFNMVILILFSYFTYIFIEKKGKEIIIKFYDNIENRTTKKIVAK